MNHKRLGKSLLVVGAVAVPRGRSREIPVGVDGHTGHPSQNRVDDAPDGGDADESVDGPAEESRLCAIRVGVVGEEA